MAPASSPVALITGGASGMGLLIAQHLLSQGWYVTAVDLNDHDWTGVRLVERLGAYAEHTRFVKANVAKYNELAAAFVETWRTWGRLDFAFANAGIGDKSAILAPTAPDPTDDAAAPPAPDTTVLDVCLTAVVYTTYLALHYMRKNANKGGKIIATSSQFGLYADDIVPMYVGAKHGVVGFTRAIAIGVAKTKEPITMNCICPGGVDTGLGAGLKSVTPEVYMTPHSTIVEAVMSFLEDDSKNGLAAECSVQAIRYHSPPPLPDEATKYLINVSFEKLRSVAGRGEK